MGLSLRKGFIIPALAVFLFSCSVKDSVPRKGYELFKEQIATSLDGLDNLKIYYNSCNYVYITGSGTEDVGSLKGTVWYRVNYTISSLSNSISSDTYLYYKEGTNFTTELGKSDGVTSYNYANELINRGALEGIQGSL